MNSHFSHSLAFTIVAVLAGSCAAVQDQHVSKDHRPFYASNYTAQLTTAGGKYDHEVNDSVNGDAPAGLIAFEFEGLMRKRVGAGVALEFISSSDHLFEDQGGTPGHAESFEISPYLFYRASAGERFRMPVQFGPWIHVLTLEDQGSTDSTTWTTLGVRLALEPEIVIERTEDFEWSLFTSIAFNAGATRIDLDTTGGDEEFDSHASGVGFEAGPRLRWSRFHAGLSFIHRGVFFDDGGPIGALAVSETNSVFNGLALTLGGGF